MGVRLGLVRFELLSFWHMGQGWRYYRALFALKVEIGSLRGNCRALLDDLQLKIEQSGLNKTL